MRPSDPPPFAPSVFAGSLFLSGFAPIMRGTSGSILAALGLYAWVHFLPPPAWGMAAMAATLGVISLLVAERAISAGHLRGDPDWFVLDEAAGLALTLALTRAASPLDFCFALAVFRFYDIAKPWPTRSFEHLPRSIGIVADDLAAACMGAWTIWTFRLLTTGGF